MFHRIFDNVVEQFFAFLRKKETQQRMDVYDHYSDRQWKQHFDVPCMLHCCVTGEIRSHACHIFLRK